MFRLFVLLLIIVVIFGIYYFNKQNKKVLGLDNILNKKVIETDNLPIDKKEKHVRFNENCELFYSVDIDSCNLGTQDGFSG